MMTYKHGFSGKHFIFIQDSGNNKALFVTPLSEIKVLELSLFSESDDQEEDYLVNNNLIKSDQLHKFHEYEGRRSEDNFENALDIIDEMSELQKKMFLEKLLKIKQGRDS